ncbi:MAG: Ig-like domain-containing protein, partial [bacterium]
MIPASIAAVSTDTLRGAVGAQVSLPLAVIVKNKAGEALDTVLVTYTVESGNGTLSGPTARTNATGQASVTWTLGSSVGLQTVTATIGALTPVTFRAVATVGTPATMTKVTGDNQTVTINTNVPVAPSVKIVDRFGNPISGTLVSFAVGSGGGSVNGGAVNTDANGVATVTSWRLGGTIGANTLVVTGGGLTATFTATASVGAPATLVLTPATIGELSLGQTQQLTARVSDAAGNVIPNATVTYATTNAAVAAVSTSGLITASGAGTANVSATAGTASASVAITVIGHPLGTTVTDSLDLGAVAPGDIAFTQDKMFVGLNGQQSILVMDGAGRTTLGTIPVTSPIPILLAPPKATGPVVAINPATLSRLWFVNPGTATVVDSLDIPNVIQTAAMTSDGTRVYAMLDNGNLAVVNATTHALQTLITLGGGVSKIRIAPGDSLLYATTNVGVIFEVDTRSNTIRR